MDRSEQLTDGRYFPYYSDDQIEVRLFLVTFEVFSDLIQVFYHVATSMPTVSVDLQQIAKKRHIGNDYVHIVFNEDT